MPWRQAPVVDFEQQPEYQWPFWNVGCREADLFGELHQRFNEVPNPTFIQDPDAFHADVFELARDSANKDEFIARLQERRDLRLKELDDFRRKIYILLRSGFTSLDDNQVCRLMHMNLFATLDSIVALYASLLAPNEYGEQPSLDEFLPSDERRRRRENRLQACDPQSKPAPSPADATDPASTSQSKMPTPPHLWAASPRQREAQGLRV
ncbi:hypothetical protein HRG_001673 [Hirsutella rhossiliensis]|uniref:Uncharacterized protein n=1 Tax=Hirsutella rhossiliensis TaxID=111463 RepID=A0A9P8N3Q3_9HYPO|nr:uncharacterized protein HRG_01673 [Hirsutella rhossiliensis]KAH0966264.1 hypothetical protein HRG_01673 [Hirsutella rhossiliensis]